MNHEGITCFPPPLFLSFFFFLSFSVLMSPSMSTWTLSCMHRWPARTAARARGRSMRASSSRSVRIPAAPRRPPAHVKARCENKNKMKKINKGRNPHLCLLFSDSFLPLSLLPWSFFPPFFFWLAFPRARRISFSPSIPRAIDRTSSLGHCTHAMFQGAVRHLPLLHLLVSPQQTKKVML